MLEAYKIIKRGETSKRQLKKWEYIGKDKFLKYGKDIYNRHHNKRYVFEKENYLCEFYKLNSENKWIKIETPKEFKND